MKIALVLFSIAAILGSGAGCAAMSSYNGLNSQEKGVTAAWRSSQEEYDSFWKKVKEIAGVADEYKNGFREALVLSLDARYAGKNPAISFITEAAGGTLSPEIYIKLANVIESGRDDFKQSQNMLIDRQTSYGTALTDMPAVFFVGFFGFPHEVNGDLRPARDTDGDGLFTVLDYPIVTSSATKEAFSTGEADEIDVFGKKDAAVPAATPAP